MVEFYCLQIKLGKITTLKEVPEQFREDVATILNMEV